MPHAARRLAVAATIAALAAAPILAQEVSSELQSQQERRLDLPDKQRSKLDSSLQQVLASDHPLETARALGIPVTDETLRVTILTRADAVDAVRSWLEKRRAQQILTHRNAIEAGIQPMFLRGLEKHPGVVAVRKPSMATVDQPADEDVAPVEVVGLAPGRYRVQGQLGLTPADGGGAGATVTVQGEVELTIAGQSDPVQLEFRLVPTEERPQPVHD